MVEFSPDELALLSENVKPGSEIDSIPRIPDVPDIAPGGRVEKHKPARVVGLSELKASEIPHAGQHFVVWGSKLLDDIYARPVTRTSHLTEDAYAARMRSDAKRLIELGIKNPLHKGQDRDDRAETYARWRYKGYVCGEVFSL